jgi:hypothetical protein
MDKTQIPDFRPYAENWFPDLELLRQNQLLNDADFGVFARDHGVPISAVTGIPIELHKRTWLTSDATDYDGGPLFHPFRLYAFHKIL